MACDKQSNVRFRVVKKTDWWWEKAQDGVKRIKYYVRRDSDEKDVLVAEKRTDLRGGATYVAECWCILLYKGKQFHFSEGSTTEVDGPAAAPQDDAPTVEPQKTERWVDAYELLTAIVSVAKNLKDFAHDKLAVKDTEFDGDDYRTMLIQAFREGAVWKEIKRKRGPDGDIPF